jgi:hypothetical protein
MSRGSSRGSPRDSSSTTSPTPRVWVPRHIALLIACRRLLRLLHATECLGTSRGSSRGSSRRSSSTTSPPPRVRVPRHVAPLVIDYSTSRRLIIDYSASLRLVVDNSASRRLVIDYFASAARPGALARHAPRHAARRAARRRILRLAQAHRRLLRLRCASGCLDTSRGSSRRSLRGSSSTTSPTPRVWVPRHVARLIAPLIIDYSVSRRLVVDYFASVARPGASARRADCLAACR